jgi:hypothetical protein
MSVQFNAEAGHIIVRQNQIEYRSEAFQAAEKTPILVATRFQRCAKRRRINRL